MLATACPEWQAVKLTFFAPLFCQRCMKINRARIIITVHLTIIPQVHGGYELAIIISYPTSVIVLFKTPSKYWEFFPTLFCKNNRFSAFSRRVQLPYFYYLVGRYSGSYAMMAKPIRALELHYPMIQFLINCIIFFLIYRLLWFSTTEWTNWTNTRPWVL